MKNNNTKIIITLISIIFGLLCTYYLSPEAQTRDDIQKDIANKIIRFHVRANSDSDEDQALKLKVKDRVVEYLSEDMKLATSKNDSTSYIKSHINEIEKIALEAIQEEGYNYTVHAYLTSEYFPTKSYEGKNWWCILYPPLCFVQGSYGIATDESKMLLKNVLDEDEFNYISDASSKDIDFEFKFLSFFK